MGPDACDFRMYSELKRIEHMPVIKGILKSRPQGDEFILWYGRMSKDCDIVKHPF